MKWWGWGAEDKQPNIDNMPKFLPFLSKTVGCDASVTQTPIDFEAIQLPDAIIHDVFVQKVQEFFQANQIKQDKLTRLQHAYGKSFRDLWRIRQGLIERAPDLVIYVETTEQVKFLLESAIENNICLIAFGGGTNIVGAVEAPVSEKRMVVCVNLSRMNKVLALDPVSQTARIQAGALGPEIEAQLNEQGFSLGHFPDSFEFSSLGGWLATRSVGMQSDRFGTIADMTLSVDCVTPQGLINTKPYPHASMGPDLRELLLGSEGTLGIITEAVMKVHPVEEQQFGAILFPDFISGIHAIQNCLRENCLPSMMRLLDVDETQLSFHLKPGVKKTKQLIENIIKKIMGRLKKIDFSQCCIAIIAFSGSAKLIVKQRKKVLQYCRMHGGVYLGQSPGKQWYARKYDYPYLRDLVMDFGGVVDVAETSILWGKIEPFYAAVKQAGYQAMSACIPAEILEKLPKPGYLGCHLSHHYDNGTCLYFTFGFLPEAGAELEQYQIVKSAMTDAIVAHGGSLSHHHSVGYEHAKWLPSMLGEVGIQWLQNIKSSIDPQSNLKSSFLPALSAEGKTKKRSENKNSIASHLCQ